MATDETTEDIRAAGRNGGQQTVTATVTEFVKFVHASVRTSY
jgi:hypothetical protein